jgi:hypothetical protein
VWSNGGKVEYCVWAKGGGGEFISWFRAGWVQDGVGRRPRGGIWAGFEVNIVTHCGRLEHFDRWNEVEGFLFGVVGGRKIGERRKYRSGRGGRYRRRSGREVDA